MDVLKPGKYLGDIPKVKDPLTLLSDKKLCKMIESRCLDYITY
jgi:hypothetical protein